MEFLNVICTYLICRVLWSHLEDLWKKYWLSKYQLELTINMHYKEEEGGARLSKVINRQGCSAVEAMFPKLLL